MSCLPGDQPCIPSSKLSSLVFSVLLGEGTFQKALIPLCVLCSSVRGNSCQEAGSYDAHRSYADLQAADTGAGKPVRRQHSFSPPSHGAQPRRSQAEGWNAAPEEALGSIPEGSEVPFPGARAADNLAPPVLQIQPLAPLDLPAGLPCRPASQHNDTVHLDDSQPDWCSPAYSDAWQRADGQRADRDELRFIPRQVQMRRGTQGSRFGFMRSSGSRKVPHRQGIPVAVRQSPERRTSPSPAAARCEARQASRRLEAFKGRRGLERARSLREEAPSSAGVDDEMKRPHMRPPKRPNERDVAHWGGKDTWGNDRSRMIGAPKEVVRRQLSDRKIGWGRVAHPQPLVRQEQIEQARWSQPVREIRQARTAFNIQASANPLQSGVSHKKDDWGAVAERPNSLWQELPAPLFHEVAKKLEHNRDVAAMRTTCRSAWCS